MQAEKLKEDIEKLVIDYNIKNNVVITNINFNFITVQRQNGVYLPLQSEFNFEQKVNPPKEKV